MGGHIRSCPCLLPSPGDESDVLLISIPLLLMVLLLLGGEGRGVVRGLMSVWATRNCTLLQENDRCHVPCILLSFAVVQRLLAQH